MESRRPGVSCSLGAAAWGPQPSVTKASHVLYTRTHKYARTLQVVICVAHRRHVRAHVCVRSGESRLGEKKHGFRGDVSPAELTPPQRIT